MIILNVGVVVMPEITIPELVVNSESLYISAISCCISVVGKSASHASRSI